MWIFNIYLTLIFLVKPNLRQNVFKLEYNNTWITFNIRPDEPTLSCYLKDDLWYCTNDTFLNYNLDPEDSY